MLSLAPERWHGPPAWYSREPKSDVGSVRTRNRRIRACAGRARAGRARAALAGWNAGCPFCLLAVALPIALLTTWKTLDWLPPGGRPSFPGFFVMENRVVPTVGLFDWTGMTHQMPFAARIRRRWAAGPLERRNLRLRRIAPPGTIVELHDRKRRHDRSRRVPTMLFRPLDYSFDTRALRPKRVRRSGRRLPREPPQAAEPVRARLPPLRLLLGSVPPHRTALYHPELAWLSPVYFIVQAVFPATFIHFGLVFPVELGSSDGGPILLVIPYVVSAALLAWIFHSYFAEPPSWLPVQATFLYSGISMPIFLGLLAYSYWENRSPMVRPRLQMMIPWFAVAAATAVYGFLNTGADGDFPMNLIAVTPIFFFASLAYAIAAHDAFDINRLLRRTALYFALTLVIAGRTPRSSRR